MTSVRQLRKEFLDAARRGTGRAYLLLQAHPEVDFSAEISEVASHNFAYDGQSEGSRAAYAFGLYRQATKPQQMRIRRAVLRALAAEQEDVWSLKQLYELAGLLAGQGHAAAKTAIYRRFRQPPLHGASWAGTREILVLDGLAGLRHIARQFGRTLATDAQAWYDDDLLNDFRQLYPEQDGEAELRQLARHDADVARYLQGVADVMALRHRTTAAPPAQPLSLADLLRLPPRHIRGRLRRRGLSAEEARELAERLLAVHRQAEREKLLACFTVVPFPLDYRLLLPLAAQRAGRRRAAALLALDALSLLSGPEIRELALATLPTPHQPGYYTDLLIHNYQPGDADLLTRQVEHTRSPQVIEQLAGSYGRIYEANPTPECAAPLLALYGKMTCGYCREKVVRLLLANQVLPAWLNAELPHDSYPDTPPLYQPPA